MADPRGPGWKYIPPCLWCLYGIPQGAQGWFWAAPDGAVWRQGMGGDWSKREARKG
jgi:hypothetical protein